MTIRNFSALMGSDEKGVSQVIGTVITIAVVVILASFVSSVFFEEYGDASSKVSPAAKLHVFFTEDGDSLEFEHNGGDPLFFDSSSLSVVMDINDTSYPLNDSAIGTLEVGESKALPLNMSGLPAMELMPEDRISVKVVDHESGGIIANSQLKINAKITVVPVSLG